MLIFMESEASWWRSILNTIYETAPLPVVFHILNRELIVNARGKA